MFRLRQPTQVQSLGVWRTLAMAYEIGMRIAICRLKGLCRAMRFYFRLGVATGRQRVPAEF